jgi:ribonuclease H / adenosylcobalamin/alpha-ribazole phosphatase
LTAIVLVRHAPTTWSGRRYCGRADPPLSPAGRRMARDLAVRLAPTLPGDVRIVTSPSRRTRATADAIASRLPGTAVAVDDRWLETDVGLVEGLTFDEVAARFPTLAEALLADAVDVDWPGGETAAALRIRIAAAWAAVIESGRPTVVVSHAGSIRMATAIATGQADTAIAFLEPAAWTSLEIPEGLVAPAG